MSKGTGQESGVNKFVKCMTGLMAGMMQTLCRSATLDESRGLSLWTHDFSSQCRPFPYKWKVDCITDSEIWHLMVEKHGLLEAHVKKALMSWNEHDVVNVLILWKIFSPECDQERHFELCVYWLGDELTTWRLWMGMRGWGTREEESRLHTWDDMLNTDLIST